MNCAGQATYATPFSRKGGGSVIPGKTEVQHVGYSAQVADPDGNRVGLVQFTRE